MHGLLAASKIVLVGCRPTFVIALIGLLAMHATAQVFDPGPSDSALFDTVIDLPPAPNVGFRQSIGGDGFTTQLNLDDGGFIGSQFEVREGAELNVRGGMVNSSMDVRSGGELNISGGQIGISGQAFNGSHVIMTGGLIDQFFEVRFGAVMELRGGAVGRRFRALAGNDLTIFGSNYKLNGVTPFLIGPGLSLNANDVLTGTLEDGSAFIFSPQTEDVFLNVKIRSSLGTPAADPTPIFIDSLSPARPSGLRAGQTLTLLNGGELPDNFEAVDATVNIEGGFLNNDSGFSRSTVNISGGEGGTISQAYAGTTINLTGGEWGFFSAAHSGSTINVDGGTLGFDFLAQAGSTINLNAGVTADHFTAFAGSEVNIAGGAIGFDFDIEEGSDAELFGGEFRLNGEAFTGDTITVGENDVFTATLEDGSSHIFAGNRGNRSDDITGLKLVQVALPTLDTTPQVINTADHGRPSGLRAGQTLTVQEGGVLGNFFEMVEGSTLTIDGGILGEDAAVLGGTINLNSGEIKRALIAGAGSVVNISGGTTGNQWEARAGSVINISGGDLGSSLEALPGSVINISGGTFEEELIAEGGTINITGGDIGEDFEVEAGSLVNIFGGTIGDSIRFESGSEINLFGSDFLLDGVLLDDTLSPGIASNIFASDSLLSGILADGSAFSFDFSDSGEDDLSSGATLTVTLVEGLAGDFDLDGVVSGSDFLAWQRGNSPNPFSEFDLAVWRTNYNTAAASPLVSTTVPEPSTLVLIASAALFATLKSRKK